MLLMKIEANYPLSVTKIWGGGGRRNKLLDGLIRRRSAG
jgi:hypothetical protein